MGDANDAGTIPERRDPADDGQGCWRDLRERIEAARREGLSAAPDVALGRALRLLVYRHMREERRVALTRLYELYLAYERMRAAATVADDPAERAAWATMLDDTLLEVLQALDRAAIEAAGFGTGRPASRTRLRVVPGEALPALVPGPSATRLRR